MKELTCSILNMQELYECSYQIEQLLNGYSKPLSIKLNIGKNVFEETIKKIIPMLKNCHEAFIRYVNVLNNDYKIEEEDKFPLVWDINNPMIIKFPIPEDMVINVSSHAIFLNEVYGTINLIDENSSVLIKKAEGCKITTIKSFKKCINDSDIYIKGDEIL